MIRIGVDVGGTFTDIVLERSGPGGSGRQVAVTKLASTPQDQSEAVVEGILKVCRLAGVAPGDIDAVFHGTTVATNMVIERSGARGRHDHDARLPRHPAHGAGTSGRTISRCSSTCRGSRSRWSGAATAWR